MTEPTRAEIAYARLAPKRFSYLGLEIEAVQLIEDETDTEIFEWAPGKWRWERNLGMTEPCVVGMTIWATAGGGPKTVAYFGDWVAKLSHGGFIAISQGNAAESFIPIGEDVAARANV